MSRHTEGEIRQLREHLEVQCQRVRDQVRAAVDLVSTAQRASSDPQGLERDIDRAEVLLEEQCLRVMALHHPVGSDLRFLVTVLRANGDLERIADHAFGVLRAASHLQRVSLSEPTRLLAEHVHVMVDKAFRALQGRDLRSAQMVLDGIPAMRGLADASWGASRTRAGSGNLADLDLSFLEIRIGQDLRRIGDLACNLAEDACYLEEGRIVRHGGGEEPA
ncbi:MAG TPA: PhoU domain-containing protein [Fibrobacteria bacterium]|nr:PhoU domain-containing protein [Fibrobacteria bacterium]HOX52468.1 PhoU domain-containing protein [Fibrobacteria bacterium]